jgi:hypothetical protein
MTAALLGSVGFARVAVAQLSGAATQTAAPAAKPAPPKAKGPTYFPPDDGQAAWAVAPGANLITVDADGIYMRQRKAENTINYAFATLPIDMPGTGAWTVDFDVKFGDLGTCPTAVALCAGNKIIGWVGADSYYKVMGSFFGKDFFTDVRQGVFPLADRAWHHFQFVSDGKTIAILRDGKAIGECPSTARPDSLEVGQVHMVFGMSPAYLQQTETWVKGVDAEYEDATPAHKSAPKGKVKGSAEVLAAVVLSK